MSTQQYNRPSDIYEGEAGLANRTKYQTASSATPPEPISSSTVDGDINYLIDAVNELYDTAVSGTVPDNSITNAKLSSGTAGAVRSYDSSGDPADISPGTSGYPLVSSGVGNQSTYAQLSSTGIATAAITNGKLAASAMLSFNTFDGSATTDYILVTDTSDSGNAKRELISDFYDNSLSGSVDAAIAAVPSHRQNSYAKYSHIQSSGTDGGTATSGAWRLYPLNEETVDNGVSGSISSSVVTLPEGTYYIKGEASFDRVDAVQIRLYDNTNTAVLLYGRSFYTTASGSPGTGSATINGYITLTGSTDVQLEYRVSSTNSTTGLGINNGFGVDNIFGTLELWKVS